jgi:hypothetical protein
MGTYTGGIYLSGNSPQPLLVRWKGGWVTSTTWCGWKDGSRVKETYTEKKFHFLFEKI